MLKKLTISYLSVGTTVIAQLLIIYIFTNTVGLIAYGEWVVLYTIPGYLSIVELGIPALIGTRMAKSIVRNQFNLYSIQFLSAASVLLINAFLISISGFIAYICFHSLLLFESIKPDDLPIIISSLFVYVFACWTCNLFENVYKASNLYPESVVITSIIRIVELVFPTLSLFNGGGIYEFALLLALSRVTLSFLFLIYFSVLPRLYVSSTTTRSVKRYCKGLYFKGLKFSLFPIGNAMLLQGITIVVAIISSPSTVAIFSISRTLSRLIVQSVAAINKMFWQKLTVLAATSNYSAYLNLQKNILVGVTLYSIFLAVLIFSIKDMIAEIWAGGINFDSQIMIALLASACASSIWQSYWVALMSINRSEKFGIYFIQVLCASLLLIFMLIDFISVFQLCTMLFAIDMVLIYISRHCLREQVARRQL